MSMVKNSNEVQSSAATKILWIGFPPCIPIDEQRLYNALILFGEIECIRIFPTTHHALVEFRSAEEARRTKDGIQGRLFDDPRIQVLYSNGENGPVADHKVMSPSLPREGPSPSGSGSQFGSVQGFGRVSTIGPTFPPQRNLHGTETLTRVSLPAPAPTFHKFPDRVNVNSSGPGNWSKPTPMPTFHQFSDAVNITSPGPGNWSKPTPVINPTNPSQANQHGTETLRNVSLPTPTPAFTFQKFSDPVNINSSGPGNWGKPPQVIGSTTPQTNLHGTETLRNIPLPTSAFTFHKFADPVDINSSAPGNWSKSAPVKHLPTNAWDANVSERDSKRARIDESLPITGASGTSTSIPAEMGSGAVPNNIGPRSYGEVSQQVSTGSDNQNMGETINRGSNGNDSHDQFPVGVEPLLTLSSAARTDQEDCYGAVEGSCFWQGTIAKCGIPVCNARCISVRKSFEAKFPKVLNFYRKTDLEILTDRFYQACGFALYYFMPERDQDVEPYQEYLEYMSSENRSCVAEFDGTTLFLVPPSDFSEHVLKAPDRSHIFGVVLKFPQKGNAMQQTTMLSQSPLQLHDKRQQFPFSTQMPMKEDPTQSATDNMPRSLSTLNGMHTEQIASPEMANQIPGIQPAAISLTTELIATLASRFTNKFRASTSGDSPSAPITSTGHDQPNNNQNITSLVASQQKTEPVEGGPASQQTLFSHVQGLRTGNEPPRHGNESLEMETDKTRSYQVTLQLAANILRELQQKEQGNKQI